MNIISAPEKIGQYDPASAGMLEESARHTIVLNYNCLDEVEETLRREGDANRRHDPEPDSAPISAASCPSPGSSPGCAN